MQAAVAAAAAAHAADAAVPFDRDTRGLDRETIEQKLRSPNSQRLFYLKAAIQSGVTIEDIYDITGIDRWFLRGMFDIVDLENELAALV